MNINPSKHKTQFFSKPDLKGICALPGKRDATSAAILVEALVVKNGDGLTQALSFYINPAAMAELPAYQKSAQRIIASLQTGPRRLNLKARAVSIGENEMEKLRLDLPPHYVFTTQRGPDFMVYHIRKVSALGTPASQFGIYLGGFPEAIKKGTIAKGASVRQARRNGSRQRARQAICVLDRKFLFPTPASRI